MFQEAGDHRLSRVLNHQGLNFLALGNLVDARSAFHNALKKSIDGGLIPIALHALAGLAAVEAKQEANQRALELVLCVLQHPSCSHETKILTMQLQAELESRHSRE